jgi:Ca2+-binding RTX toxin-like protein
MRGVIRKSLGVCAGLLLLAPASALAGEATVENGIARYDAYFGEINNVTVSELPGITAATKFVLFTDTGAEVDVDGCNSLGAHTAACLVAIDSSRANAGLGNKNDRIEPARPDISVGLNVEGDLGDDVLIGTQNRDVLDGVGGNDTLRGRSGNDALQGANGNDDLRGDAGLDDMQGGAGNDELNGDDNAGGDSIDCGEDAGDDDFALFNGDDPGDPGDLGDLLFANCERTQQG